MTQRIIPNLWFNGVADEAVAFYRQVFGEAEIASHTYYPEDGLLDFQRPLAGKTLTISFRIDGYELLAINADDTFTPNPSASTFLNFDPAKEDDARDHLDSIWQHLAEEGNVLMPLGEYSFSPRYGWIQDKYGFSWQLILSDSSGDPRPCFVPALMFGGSTQHRAREAMEFYLNVFPDSATGLVYPYGDETTNGHPEDIAFADFTLLGEWFSVMDAGGTEAFPEFTEAVSYMVECDDQAEIDKYWLALSHVPEAEQCGWCKDQFGVSWQIVPKHITELLSTPQAQQAFMAMHKIDIAKLQALNESAPSIVN